MKPAAAKISKAVEKSWTGKAKSVIKKSKAVKKPRTGKKTKAENLDLRGEGGGAGGREPLPYQEASSSLCHAAL